MSQWRMRTGQKRVEPASLFDRTDARHEREGKKKRINVKCPPECLHANEIYRTHARSGIMLRASDRVSNRNDSVAIRLERRWADKGEDAENRRW